MLNIFKGLFFTLAFFAVGSVSVQAQQNISVTVDNSSFQIPDTPIIVRSENITTTDLDLVVEVGAVHASTTLDFVVEATRVDTGDVVTLSYNQAVDGNSQTTLDVTGLLPGTEYNIVTRYSRNGLNIYSANSDVHNVHTAIDPPVLDSIDDVSTDEMTLNVVVDPVFIGDTMDFIVEVKNEDNGDTYTVQMTKNVNSSSVALNIDDLDAGTEYTFSVRYARENSSHYSDYSNEESETTDMEAPSIVDTQNVEEDSVDLLVEIGDDFSGDDVDIVVRVRNTVTGEVREIDFSEEVGSDGRVILEIDDLDENTEYEFSVRFARDGSSDFSDYSNTVTATTTGDDDDDDDGKVTLCHNGKTLSVNQNAVDAHLRHGDYLGECTEEGGDGGPRVDPTPPGTVSGGDTPVVEGDDIDKEELREAIIPEETKNVYQTAAIAGATAGSVMALAGSAVPLFTAMPGAFSSSVFLKFIELFGIIGRRKRERNWGVVFDNVTRMPIPAAKIILVDESGKEMATTYSDRDGRFGFLTVPGKYLMSIYKKDYDLITDMESDDLYGNVYDGGVVEMGDDHIVLTNIAMKSENIDWEEYANKKVKQYTSKFSTFKKYLFLALYLFGFGSTAILTFFYPNLFNICILSIYVVMFIYQTFFKKRKFGMIETNGGNPVPFAVVSLHDDDSGEKKRFAVTDAIGRYYLLADNGEYKMKAKGQPVSGASFEKQGDVKVDDGIVRKDLVV